MTKYKNLETVNPKPNPIIDAEFEDMSRTVASAPTAEAIRQAREDAAFTEFYRDLKHMRMELVRRIEASLLALEPLEPREPTYDTRHFFWDLGLDALEALRLELESL